METETWPAQAPSELLTDSKILVPLEFLPSSDNAGATATESMATRVALHPFLVGMKRRQLALLASCAMSVQFRKGQVIFREGELATRFYLIETGKVTLESSGGPGDPLLAWSCVFPSHPWAFTARAAEPTTAIYFDGTILREYCERDHSLGYELLKRMSLGMYLRLQVARSQMLPIQSDNPQPVGRPTFGDRELAPLSGCG